MAPALKDCTIALSGTFQGHRHGSWSLHGPAVAVGAGNTSTPPPPSDKTFQLASRTLSY
jgi:hypothetical protein